MVRPMRFGLLGPLEVGDGVGVAAPSRPKERALLAFFLLHPNRRIPAEELIENVWPGADPPAARRSLQVHVSRLRRILETEHRPRLEGNADGYRLRVEPGERDIDRLEDLIREGGRAVEAGDAVEAAMLLRDALALWRGSPLADVAYESFAQPELGRLYELRREAIEARFDADLMVGRHRQLVPELRAVVEAEPGHEGFCGRLMLALYRCGRQDEALAAYRRIREYLAGELGLEPSAELRELERAILNHEPELADMRMTRLPRRTRVARRLRSSSRAHDEADRLGELAATAAPHLRTPRQIEWLQRLDDEAAGLLAACRWALANNRPEFVLRLGANLWPYWESRAEIGAARAVLDAALQSAHPADPTRGDALVAVGRLALRQGDGGHAGRCFAAAATVLRRSADPAGLALASSGRGWVALSTGDVEAAAVLAREAVALADAVDDHWIRGDALNTLGTALRLAGDLGGAGASYHEAVEVRRRAGDIEGVAATVGSLAWLEVAGDELEAAEELFEGALSESEERDDVWYAAAVGLALAYTALASGDLDRARELAARGIRSCGRLGAPGLLASGLGVLAAADALGGAPGGAAILAGAAGVADWKGSCAVGATRHYGWETQAVDRALERARKGLGTVEWSRKLARGAALTPGEIHELVPV
jgi:DNA-binding SARP family transcriptional activator